MDPSRRYWHTEIGYNYRLTNIQAAIGLAQLSRAEEILRRKQEIADRYDSLLAGVEGIQLPPRTSWAHNVFWMYSILVVDPDRHDRERVRDFLGQRGIETRPFFYPLHTMPPYRSEGSFPVAESLSCRGINLPSSVTLRNEDIDRVAETVVEAMRS
jgi:perosamine synthetase